MSLFITTQPHMAKIYRTSVYITHSLHRAKITMYFEIIKGINKLKMYYEILMGAQTHVQMHKLA